MNGTCQHLSAEFSRGTVNPSHYSHLSQAVFCSVHFQGDHAVLGISTAATVYKSYSKASKSSLRKIRIAFHAGLWTAWNVKRIAKEIGCVTPWSILGLVEGPGHSHFHQRPNSDRGPLRTLFKRPRLALAHCYRASDFQKRSNKTGNWYLTS